MILQSQVFTKVSWGGMGASVLGGGEQGEDEFQQGVFEQNEYHYQQQQYGQGGYGQEYQQPNQYNENGY